MLFRLTEQEYDHLLAACAASGSRNLSDFARSHLLNSMESNHQAAQLEGRLLEVDQRLAELQAALGHINRLLQRIARTNA